MKAPVDLSFGHRIKAGKTSKMPYRTNAKPKVKHLSFQQRIALAIAVVVERLQESFVQIVTEYVLSECERTSTKNHSKF